MTSGDARRGLADGDVDRHVGQVIRQRRKALALSQSALAGALGVSFQQVQKYERGANRVSAPALWRLAEALRCPPAAFFVGLISSAESLKSDPDGFGAVGRAFLAADGGMDLARAFLAAAPSYRRALVATARVFAAAKDG